MLSRDDLSALPLDARTVVRFPEADQFGREPSAETALSQLERLHDRGINYLIVPRTRTPDLDGDSRLLFDIASRYDEIVHQKHLCSVFQLAAKIAPRRQGVLAWMRGRG